MKPSNARRPAAGEGQINKRLMIEITYARLTRLCGLVQRRPGEFDRLMEIGSGHADHGPLLQTPKPGDTRADAVAGKQTMTLRIEEGPSRASMRCDQTAPDLRHAQRDSMQTIQRS